MLQLGWKMTTEKKFFVDFSYLNNADQPPDFYPEVSTVLIVMSQWSIL